MHKAGWGKFIGKFKAGSLVILTLLPVVNKATEVSYDLRANIHDAKVYSASGTNWTTIDTFYDSTAGDWQAPDGYGNFIQGVSTTGGIQKDVIHAHPRWGSFEAATVAEYSITSPRSISIEYGLAVGQEYGEVRFVVQVVSTASTTILDSVISDSDNWHSFQYDLSLWQDQEVTVRLITDPNGHTTEDWAHWANPNVIMDVISEKRYVSQIGDDENGDGSMDNPYQTVRRGISASTGGDTLVVLPGTYEENIIIDGKGLFITSLYHFTRDTSYIRNTVLDGDAKGPVVQISGESIPPTRISGFTITNGWSTSQGGGIHVTYASPIIEHCVIKQNRGYHGGGISFHGDNQVDFYPIVRNCVISHNTAERGGGIMCHYRYYANITNCLITDNQVELFGGGLYFRIGSNGIVINTTIAHNYSTSGGGGILVSRSYPQITNAIIWGNTDDSKVGTQVCEYDGYATYTHTDMQDWGKYGNPEDPGNAGNISATPMFVAPEEGDYQLQEYSYCIGMGIYEGSPDHDLWGNPRPNPAESAPDLGAFEHHLGERSAIGKFDILTAGPIEGGISVMTDGAMYAPASGDKVYRFDETGQIAYTLTVNGDIKSATTITADHTIYIASTDNNLYSFNASGVSNPNWPLSLGSEATASVAVDGAGNIYIGTQNGIFQAISPGREVLWSYNVGAPVYASAAISTDNTLYTVNHNGRLLAFDLNTLDPAQVQPKWVLETGSAISTSPALDDQANIYVTTLGGELIKIRDEGPGGSIVWTYSTGSVIESSPVVSSANYILFGADNGYIYAVDGETGQQVWETATGEPVKSTGAVFEPGTVNRLYIGSDNRSLYVLSAETGEVLVEYFIGSAIRAPLTYSEGMVYIGTMDGRVIAIQDTLPGANTLAKRAQAKSLWSTFQGNNRRTGNQNDVNLAIYTDRFSLPASFKLHPNYPNPFNPVSTIQYDLPKGSEVSLIVYDILGREVVRLVNSYMEPGYHQTLWNGRNRLGRELPSGIYIARLVTPEYNKSIKMVLLK